jgi:uncharacterized phage protein (TIGR02218 family)
MKAASGGMQTHIAGETLTLATLWRIVRRDGAIFTFTDHDRDIVYGGETYLAPVGYRRAAISSGADLAVDETELLGLLGASSITEGELRAGVWDHAEVRIFAVNFANLGHGEIKLRRGRLGEVIVRDDGSFRAELRGLAQPLQSTVGSLYQAECRADLGDARCKVNLAFGAGLTQQGTIEFPNSSVDLLLVNDGIGSYIDSYFEGGVAIWQTGTNAGVIREVLAWNQGGRVLTLLAPPPFAPEVGDVLHIQPGCDKRAVTCKAIFNNFLNFRGEPFVPGANAILETP